MYETKLLNTVILPLTTYDAEIWTLTKRKQEKLAVSQRSMERLILNIKMKDKIRNKNIRQKTKIIDINNKIRMMKGYWAGHLAKMNNNKQAKLVTEWTPLEGQRQRGRPRR